MCELFTIFKEFRLVWRVLVPEIMQLQLLRVFRRSFLYLVPVIRLLKFPKIQPEMFLLTNYPVQIRRNIRPRTPYPPQQIEPNGIIHPTPYNLTPDRQ
jgi:hypothetical protein